MRQPIINGADVVKVGGSSKFCNKIESKTLPNGVASIIDNALKTLTLGDSVSSIGRYPFAYCKKIETITIPNGVTKVDEMAFYDCNSLESVVIPKSLTIIENAAFKGCVSLSEVYYLGSEVDKDIIDFVNDNRDLEQANWNYNVQEIEIINVAKIENVNDFEIEINAIAYC